MNISVSPSGRQQVVEDFPFVLLTNGLNKIRKKWLLQVTTGVSPINSDPGRFSLQNIITAS